MQTSSRCPKTKILLDAVVVCGAGNADHDKNLEAVLQRLTEYNATVKAEKCQFGVPEIDVAGQPISKDGVKPLQSNVDALQQIEPTANTNEAHSLLSTAAYYLKFVPDFADIATPLRVLLKKDAPFHWTSDSQQHFEKLKAEIASKSVYAN